MERISVTKILEVYTTDRAFIDDLCHSGLLNMIDEEEEKYLEIVYLPDLEKFMRWHYEMNINLEGIEVIQYLLEKINTLYLEKMQLSDQVNVIHPEDIQSY